MQRVRLVALALAIALSATAAARPGAAAEDEPAPLKFGWPVPSKATVTERILRRGHPGITRYTVALDRVVPGDDLRVHLADFEFLELDGRPASDPTVAAQVAVAVSMSKFTPDLLIAADGRVKDLVGLDDTIDAMLKELETSGTAEQKASIPNLRVQYRRPEVREAKKREATRPWQAWVGEWIGRTVPDGGRVESSFPIRCPDGVDEDAATTLTRASSTEGPGLAKLVRETTLEGEAAKPAFDRWIAKARALPGGAPPATAMRLSERVVAITDPVTLLPKRVIREERYVLVMPLGDDAVQTERHEYEFEWAAAAKPAATPASEK